MGKALFLTPLVYERARGQAAGLVISNWKVSFFLFPPASISLVSPFLPSVRCIFLLLFFFCSLINIQCLSRQGWGKMRKRRKESKHKAARHCAWVSSAVLVAWGGHKGGEELRSLAGGGCREHRDGRFSCSSKGRNSRAAAKRSLRSCVVLSPSSDLLRVLDRAGCLSWPFREGCVYRGAPLWQGGTFLLELFQLPIWEELAYRLQTSGS